MPALSVWPLWASTAISMARSSVALGYSFMLIEYTVEGGCPDE